MCKSEKQTNLPREKSWKFPKVNFSKTFSGNQIPGITSIFFHFMTPNEISTKNKDESGATF